MSRIPTSVVLGTHNLKKVGGTMRYAVEKTCIHPDYTDVQRGNDIMLLKVSSYPFIQSLFMSSICFASGLMQDTEHAMNWSLIFVSPAV